MFSLWFGLPRLIRVHLDIGSHTDWFCFHIDFGNKHWTLIRFSINRNYCLTKISLRLFNYNIDTRKTKERYIEQKNRVDEWLAERKEIEQLKDELYENYISNKDVK